MKSYVVLYAEDIPHYGVREFTVADDQLAIQRAIDITPAAMSAYTNDPDHVNSQFRRIVHIEGPDGIIAEDICLDERDRVAAATDMLAALVAQEMAEADPAAVHRKGYFDIARKLRKAAIA
jgi:hypothetical protein